MQGGAIRVARIVAGLAAATLLVACDVPSPVAAPVPAPQPVAAAPVAAAPNTGPSPASRALAQYYSRVQADLLAQGLLRTDGGGPDTPFDAEMVARNFERIAFFDEYERGGGLARASNRAGALRRWTGPVRFGVEFGASVPVAQQAPDRQGVAGYVARLARATGHPMTMASPAGANYNVLIMGEDDRAQMIARVTELVPNIDRASLQFLQQMPRSIHCLVMAFSDPAADQVYTRAIAVIRAEHPDLMRRSCVHEELAQGLGLANDSPAARPSIFNDDDEFAFLTTQDEVFLRILYDPRLAPGLPLSTARPIVMQIATERVGGSS